MVINVNRSGFKVELECTRCKRMFSRQANTIRPEQKAIFCSQACLRKSPEELEATKQKNRLKWRENNKAKMKEQCHDWKLKNPERHKELKKLSYHRHAEEINARAKERRETDPEYREKGRLRSKEDYAKNKKRYSEYGKRRWKENPEKMRAFVKKHRDNNRHSLMWSGAKKTAKQTNVNFDLTKEWVKERLAKGVCGMSGLAFDMEGKRTPNSPSIDRIKPGQGYTMDNCRIVLWSINRALNNYGEEYVLDVFEAILSKKKAEHDPA